MTASSAVISLTMFTFLSSPFKIIGVFLGGFLLSPTYSASLLYLEGRRETEIMAGAFTTSPIFGGAIARAIAAAVLETGIRKWFVP